MKRWNGWGDPNLLHNPEENRLRLGWRLAGFSLLSLLSTIVFGIIFIPIVIWSVWRGINFLLPASLIGLVSITASVYIARRILDKRSFASLGLKLDRKAIIDLLFGFGLTAAMIGLVFAIEWVAGWLTFESFVWQQHSPNLIFREVLTMLVTFIAVGWQEELLSRGYLLQNVEEGLNLPWAILISSLFFSMAHYANPGFNWLSLVGLLLSGYFLAFAYIRTRSLWLPIGLHIGWNFFEGTVFGFPVSGMDMYGLILHTVDGPTIWTGGDFGPEAGVVLVPALLLGMISFLWYTQAQGR